MVIIESVTKCMKEKTDEKTSINSKYLCCLNTIILNKIIFLFQVKCEQYWDFGTKHFENITVTTTSEIPLEDWTIRDFDIKNGSGDIFHTPKKNSFGMVEISNVY